MHGGDIYRNKIEYDFSVNTNPLGIVPRLHDALVEAIELSGSYPDLEQELFRSKISSMEHVSINEVYGGNGASELFMAIVRTFMPKKALVVSPSFSGYEYALDSLKGVEIAEYVLKESENFNIGEDFLEYIDTSVQIVFLANPNNPTGRSIDEGMMLRILDRCQRVGAYLVVDECFINMAAGAYSVKGLINQYSKLLVVDAFTKLFAIPGIRVGFIISSANNIVMIKRQIPEWSMSTLAQYAGAKCADIVMKTDFLEKTKKTILEEKVYLCNGLTKLGIEHYESDTAYILIRAEEGLYSRLLSRKILIRDCSSFKALGKGYFRIAVKTREANAALLKALGQCV